MIYYIDRLKNFCVHTHGIADLSTDKGKKEVTKIFTEQLKVKRNHNGEPIE